MESNTHDEIYKIKNGGYVFMSGVPDECEHDWTGDTEFVSKSGRVIKWHTYKQWAGYTSELRDKLIQEHHIEIDDPIIQGGVTCRKCKKPFTPDLR